MDPATRAGRPRTGAWLALAALGVVYGDIGTSPLYALRECFAAGGGVPVTPENVLGVVSMIFWALIVVVTLKYVLYISRADHDGEGGILALLTLVLPKVGANGRGRATLLAMGLFGACLLYGDGMITPAISVLSAVEGLEVATPAFRPYVLPIAVAILSGLFLVQRRGTSAVGAIFGPVTLVWFLCLAAMGLPWILREPRVLGALLPTTALGLIVHHPGLALGVSSGVFLVVTGGEALYADLGHFGARPIRRAWFAVVLPALVVHYFGQGGLLLRDPAAVENPFYLLAPEWALYPLVALATVATVIASQAVITGAFSLTHQAVQLGFLPRLKIDHTSKRHHGQIYVPVVNGILFLATVGLVLGFGSSEALAGAYGVAVVTTMVITTVLGFVCSRRVWGWGAALALPVSLGFLAVDLGFLASNVPKVPQGGWFPLVIAAVTYLVMTTWRKGHENVVQRLNQRRQELPEVLAILDEEEVHRVPGMAVFLDGDPFGVPQPLVQNLRTNHVLHEHVVLMTIQVHERPRMASDERLEVVEVHPGIYRVLAHVGYLEDANVPDLLRKGRDQGLPYEGVRRTHFFLGRETLIKGQRHAMPWWRESLFVWLDRNERRADDFFGVPPDRVTELGIRMRV